MDISAFNGLADLPFEWLFIKDSPQTCLNSSSLNTENLVVVVPELSVLDKLCKQGINFRGIIRSDFMSELNELFSSKNIVSDLNFSLNNYCDGLEILKTKIDADLWKRIHLFTDEAVSNIVLHSGKTDGEVDTLFLDNGNVIVSVSDCGGRLASRNLKKAMCSLCSAYLLGRDMAIDNLVIGGNGLRLLFHYVTFIKFNVLPFESTQVIGYFSPNKQFNGFIFEDRREEILNDCLFRKD